jgi:diguanylate cyclase (GGDEF)-like protein
MRRDRPSVERTRWELVLLGPVAMAGYVALPSSASEVWFQVVAWCSIAAVGIGMRRQRATSRGWLLVVSGFASFAVGDLLFALDEYLFSTEAFPSSADVFYLAGYPAIAAGLAVLVRAGQGSHGRTALIDAGIVTVPITVIGWLWFVEPVATGPDLSSLQRIVSAAYPIGDLLCIALVVRLLAGGRRSAGDAQALRFLIGSLGVLLVADGIFLGVTLHGDYVSGGWSDSLYLLSYVLLGVAGAHPLENPESPDQADEPLPLTPARLALLTGAALVTPAVLVVQWSNGGAIAVPLVVAGTSMSFLLVVARMAGLVQALDRSQEQLRFEARHDVLTGLPNRLQLSVMLDRSLSAGEHGALLFVDLDRFKAVNDTLGHAAGDDVLVEVASILRGTVRPTDVVARLSGDEFVVMLRHCDEETAAAIARRVVEQLHVRRRSADTVLAVTASVGMSTWPAGTPADAAHRLMTVADRAMYEAKHASGNRLVVATPG